MLDDNFLKLYTPIRTIRERSSRAPVLIIGNETIEKIFKIHRNGRTLKLQFFSSSVYEYRSCRVHSDNIFQIVNFTCAQTRVTKTFYFTATVSQKNYSARRMRNKCCPNRLNNEIRTLLRPLKLPIFIKHDQQYR